MTLWIDRIIDFCKWPIGLFLFLALPFLLRTWPNIVMKTVHQDFLPFWAGLLGYLLLWNLMFRKTGSFLPTLEHESIHALFALLTGHRVVDFQVRWSTGGHVGYVGGKGNWLITLSPYFFPLILIVLMGVLSVWTIESVLRCALLGLVFGFELVSTWRQIHRQQPDLQKVGWLYCVVFLPPALLLIYGSVLIFLNQDAQALCAWYGEGVDSVYAVSEELWKKIRQIVVRNS